MSVDGLKSDRAVMDALTALKKRRTKSTEAALLTAVMAVMEDRADSQRGLVMLLKPLKNLASHQLSE